MIKKYLISKYSLIFTSLIVVITVLHKTGVLEKYYVEQIPDDQSVVICVPPNGIGNQFYGYAAGYNFSKRHN
jgi:hypothetical protein